MKLMEEIFFSFTFGGEALALAAARATLRKLRSEDVIGSVRRRGERIIAGTSALIEKHGIGELLSVMGQPAWSFLVMRDVNGVSQFASKTLFMQEVLQRGILSFGSHNLSYAHSDADIDRLLSVYDEVFPLLRAGALGGRMNELLRCKPLEPLFRVR